MALSLIVVLVFHLVLYNVLLMMRTVRTTGLRVVRHHAV